MKSITVTAAGILCMSKYFWDKECDDSMAEAISDILNYDFEVTATASKFGLCSRALSENAEQYRLIIQQLPSILDMLKSRQSKPTKDAILERLLTGREVKYCAIDAGLDQGNLSRALISTQKLHKKAQETARVYKQLGFI